MAKLDIVKGATSVLCRVFIQDSSKTDGSGLAGLAFNTSGLVCSRARDDDGNAGATTITLVTATRGTWASGGFVEKDSTNQKGVYEFGIPNAAIATGSRSVLIYFYGATNMAPCVMEIELTGVDNQDGVHGGMSALPNTACTTNASLITSGTGTDQLQVASGIASADAKKINAVSTSSVTTVNANQGTTQPLNFTGTAGSALVKSDMVDIAGSAVSTSSAQIGVNVVQMNAVSAASITTINANQGTTQPINFTGTAAAALAKVDVTDWNAAAVAAPNVAGVPKVDIVDWLGSAPNALISGRVDSNAQVVGTGAIVSGSFAAGAIDSSALNATAANKVWTSTNCTEPTAITAASPTSIAALSMLHTMLRNKITQTSSTQTLFANDGTTAITTFAVSDDGTTFTKGKGA